MRFVRRSTLSLPLPNFVASLKSGMSESRLARGYGRFATIRTVIFLIAGQTRLLEDKPAYGGLTRIKFDRAIKARPELNFTSKRLSLPFPGYSP